MLCFAWLQQQWLFSIYFNCHTLFLCSSRGLLYLPTSQSNTAAAENVFPPRIKTTKQHSKTRKLSAKRQKNLNTRWRGGTVAKPWHINKEICRYVLIVRNVFAFSVWKVTLMCLKSQHGCVMCTVSIISTIHMFPVTMGWPRLVLVTSEDFAAWFMTLLKHSIPGHHLDIRDWSKQFLRARLNVSQ